MNSVYPHSNKCWNVRLTPSPALSGDGGDEVFGGYARFLDVEADYLDNAVKRLLRALNSRSLLPGS